MSSPAIVTVTGLPAPQGSDREHGDQFWTRVYARPGTGFPQIIRSLKRFSGRTGLEERVCGGWGVNFAMALAVRAERRKLTFVSAGYLVQTGRLRLALPGWMTPGTLSVTHEDLGRGWFAFELRLVHPLAGELLYQRSVFADPADTTRKEHYDG